MFTTKNETSNACPTRAVKAIAMMIDEQAQHDRNQPGHHRSEHEQEDDQSGRQPDEELALLQILLGKLFEVGVGRQRAGDRDLEAVPAVLRLHQLDERENLVPARHDRNNHGMPILRDKRLVLRGVVALGLGNNAQSLRALAELEHLRLEGTVVDRVAIRAHDHDLTRRRRGREALVNQRLRLLRLRVAGDIAVTCQRVPEQERDQEERDEKDDEPRTKRPLRTTSARTRKTLS